MEETGITPLVVPQAVVVSTPTVQERLAMLTEDQRVIILKNFINSMPAQEVEKTHFIWQDVVTYYYGSINSLVDLCMQYMRGEVIETSATYDELGVELTPVVYNIAPKTKTALVATMATKVSDFTVTSLQNTIDQIVKWSQYDGNGTWSFYSTNIKN